MVDDEYVIEYPVLSLLSSNILAKLYDVTNILMMTT